MPWGLAAAAFLISIKLRRGQIDLVLWQSRDGHHGSWFALRYRPDTVL